MRSVHYRDWPLPAIDDLKDIYKKNLTDTDFDRLSHFIQQHYGIKITPAKKILLESRLRKRLFALNIPSYKAYCQYLFSPAGLKAETWQMIDVVTTNKTDFFREPSHFQYLTDVFLPTYAARYPNQRKLQIWSAGCSTGEEPYTIAMVMSEFAYKHPINYSILGTDVSGQVLQQAQTAVYGANRVAQLPLYLKKRYFLRSKDKKIQTVRVVPALRTKVSFERINLMDEYLHVPKGQDLIFCRNVLIYFDRQTQEKVINNLCRKLDKDGYLFLGHSESIISLNVPLVQVQPTIYRKI